MMNNIDGFRDYYDTFGIKVSKKSISNRITALTNVDDEAKKCGVFNVGLFEINSLDEFIESFNALLLWDGLAEKKERKDGRTGTDLGAGLKDLANYYMITLGIEDEKGNLILPDFELKKELERIVSSEYIDPKNKFKKDGEIADVKQKDDRVNIGAGWRELFDVTPVTGNDIEDENYFWLYMNKHQVLEYLMVIRPLFSKEYSDEYTLENWKDIYLDLLAKDDKDFVTKCYIKEDAQSKPYIYFINNENSAFRYKGKILFDRLSLLRFLRYESESGDKRYYLLLKTNDDNNFFANFLLARNDNGNGYLCKYPQIDFDVKFDSFDPFFDGLYYSDRQKTIIGTQIKCALNSGKHLIFVGPPGTGKSTLAKNVAKYYVGDEYRFYTAHSEWSTFDTIGGYRLGENGSLEMSEGVLLKCFRKNGLLVNNWLLVDELNRSDINKSFGEFFSILAGDSVDDLGIKNDQGELISLVQEQDISHEVGGIKFANNNEYVIPHDWRMIGTMNTADKSALYDVSLAFVRRFAVIYVDFDKFDGDDFNALLKLWGINKKGYLNKARNKERCVDIIRCINEGMNQNAIGPALIKAFVQSIKNIEDDGTEFNEDMIAPLVTMYFLPQMDGCGKRKASDIYNELSGIIDDKNGQVRAFIVNYLGYMLEDTE